MDPYSILEIPQGASEADLKKAFRKKAMKWHPDRVGTSADAKEKFFEISHAYKVLSRELRKQAAQTQTDSARAQQNDAGEENADFKELLEYAIQLASSGYTKDGIKIKLEQKGCDEKAAESISQQGIAYAGFSSNSRADENTVEESFNKYRNRRFDFNSVAAVLGINKPGRARMQKVSYYLDIFNDLHSEIEAGTLIPFSKNRYLSKVFNRSILLFIILAVSIYYLPVIIRLIPLGLVDFFQLPHVFLSLILIWAMYRKLWLLSAIVVSFIAGTQLYFYHALPLSLEQDYRSVLLTALISYLPFLFFTRGANFFFYLKARKIIGNAEQYNAGPEEQLVIVKSRGGASTLLALIATMSVMVYFLHMIPDNGSIYSKLSWLFPASKPIVNEDFKQIQALASQSELLFNTAEQYFQADPPNYEQARLNYIGSSNYGSLLSCYKAGYLFLSGLGGEQDDVMAFKYFSKATRSPLSKQPHKLSTVTYWLAESYHALGIMYLGGYGTDKDREKARSMFQLANNYGKSVPRQVLLATNAIPDQELRTMVTYPEF